MVNIPGGSTLPGVTTSVETLSRGASVPGGTRIAAIIGEGSRSETIVASAEGSGLDGFNSEYTSVSGADGRHFILSLFPVVSNRTQLFRNGSPLVGLEDTIGDDDFSSSYDYRIDIATGKIELQKAHLVDQGGSFYTTGSSNVGAGSLNSLTLVDDNSPTETWSIKCISVQRNSLNQPIAGTGKFIAVGTVSGNKLDANGNAVVWTANNTTTSNGILSFAIQEAGTSAFREGDFFIIKVSSGVLIKNDSLTASYIPSSNINDPTFIDNMDDVVKKHGSTSLDNNLSLGCQLAFANQAPGIMCLQAAPAMPRRTSYQLTNDFKALSENDDDFIFPLPPGVVPDPDANIHFFVTNKTTNVETQVLPNKFTFYTLDTSGKPTTHAFIVDNVNPPSGNSFSYSVNEAAEALSSGFDGYVVMNDALGPTRGIFSSSLTFDASYVGKTLKLIDTVNVANFGNFTVDSVSAGKLYFHTNGFGDFTNENPLTFELYDLSTDSALPGSSGTDGVLIKISSTGTATVTSAAVNFGSFSEILNLKLKIAGSDDNNGLYDIIAYNGGSDTITIRKRFVSESDIRYEVIDPDDVSNYIVVNHTVCPDGYSLRATIVDSRDADFYDAGWISALETLEAQEIDILVALPKQTASVIFQNCLSHCITMSNLKNKKERVFMTGSINGLTPDNLTGAKAAAVEDIGILEGIQGDTVTEVLAGNIEDLSNYSVVDSFGNTYRCVYFWPDQIVCQVGTDNTLIDGFYIAAAAAGFFSGTNNIAMPLTQKTLTGFTILRNKLISTLTQEKLAAAGVSVLQPVQGGGRVIWGITTTQSGFVEEQEISIVFIRDRIAKSLRTGFQAFIGLPEDGFTQSKLTARATALLSSFVSSGLISDYKDLQVVRDSVDPTQWNISVRCAPVYPVNAIFIRVSVGLL